MLGENHQCTFVLLVKQRWSRAISEAPTPAGCESLLARSDLAVLFLTEIPIQNQTESQHPQLGLPRCPRANSALVSTAWPQGIAQEGHGTVTGRFQGGWS